MPAALIAWGAGSRSSSLHSAMAKPPNCLVAATPAVPSLPSPSRTTTTAASSKVSAIETSRLSTRPSLGVTGAVRIASFWTMAKWSSSTT